MHRTEADGRGTVGGIPDQHINQNLPADEGTTFSAEWGNAVQEELVNTIVGVSRISGLIVLLFAGYLVDRFGAKKLISAVLVTAGIATAAMWVRSRPLLIAAVFLQPLLIASIFPAVLTAAARIAPRNLQNLTISFILPIGYGFGAGVLPVLLGWLGDNASFALGFLIYGVMLVAGSALPFLLKLRH